MERPAEGRSAAAGQHRSEARFRIVLEDDSAVVCGEDATAQATRYRSVVRDVRERIKHHAFEALVVTFALASVVEAAFAHAIGAT